MIGFHGFFGKSVLVIDLDMIKQMLIKDFDYFIDKPIFDLSNKYLNSILTQGCNSIDIWDSGLGLGTNFGDMSQTQSIIRVGL